MGWETIEKKIERILDRNEPITDGAPILYQRRDEGVKAECDIRTNKWDLAERVSVASAKHQAALRVSLQGKKEQKPIDGTSTTE